MSEQGESTPTVAAAPATTTRTKDAKEWVEDLQRSVIQSKDSAIRSARSFQHNSSTYLQTLQDFVLHGVSQYKTYEDAFFSKVKDELVSAREHPAAATGVALTAGLLFMRGPRRFLFRHTFGRLRSEEAMFVRAEKNVNELNLSGELMKKESKKLLERAALAEKEMIRGETELKNAGNQVQRLAKQVYKVETQAADLMEGLREIPGREALKLRAEVASMASLLKRQRATMDKQIMKISELGVSV